MDRFFEAKHFTLFTALFLVASVGFMVPSQAEALRPGRYTFAIMSGNTPVGTHVSEFSRQGGDLVVNTTVEAGLKILFVKVFEYRHRSREVWREGQLVEFQSQTDDDGKQLFVRAFAARDGLHVESTSGSYVAPLGTMVGSLWNPNTVNQNRLIHTENGRLEDVRILAVGAEPVHDRDGLMVQAERYRLLGSLNLDLWYSVPERTLTQVRFSIRGHEVEYRPATVVANLQVP